MTRTLFQDQPVAENSTKTPIPRLNHRTLKIDNKYKIESNHKRISTETKLRYNIKMNANNSNDIAWILL